jgi:hypothetical protein
MKSRYYLSALAALTGVMFGQAVAAPVPIYNYGDPATYAQKYGDFYSFSLPILSSAVQGFTEASVSYGNSSPYFINTANVIQDALVVGTGSGGSQDNSDLGLTAGTYTNGYDFPNASGDYSFSGWNITLDSLRQYLTIDGTQYDLMAYFNNNQTNKTVESNNIWAKAKVTLTGQGKTDIIYNFQDLLSANQPYALSGGDVTFCFNWTDPSKTGANDLRTEVSCSDPHTTESIYKHNLGQNNVSYGLTSEDLNALLRDTGSGYTKMWVDVDFQGLNNGYENLYFAAACVNCGNEEVPEPGSLALFGLSLASLGFVRRQRKNSANP